MYTLPPSGNNGSSASQSEDFDAASYMQKRFEQMFGAHNYPPEVQARMAQREAELDQRLNDEAQELLESVARLSIVPDKEKELVALLNDPFAISADPTQRSTEAHVFWIKRVLSEFDEDNFDAEWVSEESITGFLNNLTDTQFTRVTDLMHQYPTLHVHSQLYVRDCLRTFASDEEADIEDLYDLLMLGYAIYPVLNAQTRKMSLTTYVMEGKQLSRGIIELFDYTGDVDDPQEYAQMAALLKFAFCLQVTDKHPGNGIRYVRPCPRFNSDENSYNYENSRLVEVIRDHADKVDLMIAFSEKHHDIDPEKLRAVAEGTPIPTTRGRI